ncbi:MAG: tRNA uridine-5-carboxymethylaminomethyl(34) synthesis GTPase MnmE [Clostridia bacterium]|nr:tRNA uridine-5-carboxymethylaminomethyl(34) synthesis GTPase MnmE [Clostridia bacterium]
MDYDTIAAVSTPYGRGGISVIRISGSEAVQTADKVFRAKSGKTLTDAPNRSINYGHIISNGEVIDEVLVSVMRAPHTFTAEDVVEINCHGGLYVTKAVLGAVYDAGARPAEAGEFTKRAFLNGRVDLTYASSVMDMINAKTKLQHKMALNHLNGKLAERIRNIRESLMETAAYIQASFDFPEELDEAEDDRIEHSLEKALSMMDNLLENADKGIVAKEGIPTVIVGKPNVGKSSLMNLLAQCDRAIVTDIPGTTRDTIEEVVTVGNLMLKLTDTAGIRETGDTVESIGVERAKNLAEIAELVLFVVDCSKPLDDADMQIYDMVKDKNTVIIANKCDLADNFELPFEIDAIKFCAKSGDGLKALTDKIEQIYISGIEECTESDTLLSGEREKDAVKKARAFTNSALTTIKVLSSDMAIDDIHSAANALNLIDGTEISDDIINTIFETYCVGK